MDKKEQIRKAAFRLFINKGLSEVSVNDIITAADVTKGCFYHHFLSKDNLIADVFDYYICSYFINVLNSVGASQEPPKERLLKLCLALLSYDDYVEHILEEKRVPFDRFYYLLTEGTRKFDFIMYERQKFFASAAKLIVSILEDGKKCNLVKQDIDSTSTAYKLLTNNEGLALINLLFSESEIKKAAADRLNDVWQSIAS